MLQEKKKFKKKMIDDVITAKSSQWYSKLKRMLNYDQHKTEQIQVEEISQLSDKDQSEAIADAFSEISNQYEPIKRENITIPPFSNSSIPIISCDKVLHYLRTRTASVRSLQEMFFHFVNLLFIKLLA